MQRVTRKSIPCS